MKNKAPTIKIIFGSIGISIALIIPAMFFATTGGILGIIAFSIFLVFGIDRIQKYLLNKYEMNVLRYHLLTMLPPVVSFVLFVLYYIYIGTHYWAELEGLLECVILIAWGGILGVSIVGTFMIAIIKKNLSTKAANKEKINSGDI